MILREIWKHFWHTRVPHKVQLFVWKCLKDILPTIEKITGYKADIEIHCRFYNHTI